MTNFQRTQSWLQACGKEPSLKDLSVQIGCHIEEFIEFLATLDMESSISDELMMASMRSLRILSIDLKKGYSLARIRPDHRAHALDALCDLEVTGNGCAFLAGFDKDGADRAVLDSNDAKLVDGKPLILEGGKIGKPPGWVAPDLSKFSNSYDEGSHDNRTD